MTTFALTNSVTDSFTAEGKAVGKAAALIQAARDKTNLNIQKHNDDLTIAWAASNVPKAKYWGKPSGPIRTMVKEMMAKGIESGAYQADMAETMVHCYGVAFLAGIPFTRDLKRTHKADGTPRESKAEAEDSDTEGSGSAGGIERTTPEATEKTARKLIKQLRMLPEYRATEVAALIVDAMLHFNPDFSETESKKA